MAFNKLRVVFKSAYEPNNLLKTNVAASGVLLLIGDVIQQSIELYRGVHDKGEPCHQGQRWRHCLWSKYIYKFYKPTIGVTYWWIWFWWFWSGSYDILRSSRMLAIGLFHGAPRHFFYVRLEKSKVFDQQIQILFKEWSFDNSGIPGTSLKCAAKKVFFDQVRLSWWQWWWLSSWFLKVMIW